MEVPLPLSAGCFFKARGTHIGGVYNKVYNALGPMLWQPYLGKLANRAITLKRSQETQTAYV